MLREVAAPYPLHRAMSTSPSSCLSTPLMSALRGSSSKFQRHLRISQELRRWRPFSPSAAALWPICGQEAGEESPSGYDLGNRWGSRRPKFLQLAKSRMLRVAIRPWVRPDVVRPSGVCASAEEFPASSYESCVRPAARAGYKTRRLRTSVESECAYLLPTRLSCPSRGIRKTCFLKYLPWA